MASPLADLYQRYKIGTRRIERWLSDTINSDSRIRNAVSLHEADSVQPDSDSASSAPVRPSTKELVAIADRIVESAVSKNRPPAELSSIVIILEDVIAGRREYKVWHQQRVEHVDEAHMREIASHDHFIDVLSNILERLKSIEDLVQKNSKAQQGRRRGGKGKKGSKSMGSAKDIDSHETTVLRNLYAGLGTEDSSLTEQMANSSLSDSQPKSAKAKIKVSLELEKPEGDDNFALWCFLKDCHKIRVFLRSVWQEYYAGDLSMQVAAEVTEQAFLLLTKASVEFTKDMPHLSSYEQVADHLKIRGQIRGGEVENFSYEGRASYGSSPSTEDAVELLCIPAFVALQSYREMINACLEGREDSFELRQSFDKCHVINRLIFDCSRTVSCLPPRVWESLESGEKYDWFTHNFVVKARYRAPRVELEEVMSYQIYMDILDVRAGRIGEFLSLGVMRGHVEDTIRSFLDDVNEVRGLDPVCILDRGQCLRDSALQFADLLFRAPRDDKPETAELQPIDNAPWLMQWIASWPVLCGKSALILMQTTHIDAMIICKQSIGLLCLAHLYRTSLEVGLLKQPWKDMEFVIDQLEAATIGLPEKPCNSNSVLACARRFGTTFGIKPSEYSKALRQNRNDGRVSLPRLRNVATSEGQTLLPKIHSLSAKIQRHQLADLELSPLDSVEISMQQMADTMLADPNVKVDPETRKQWEACRRLNSTQLLGLMKQQLIAEESAYCFDLHGFYVSCASLMKGLKEHFEPRIREQSGITDDMDIPRLTDQILWGSTGHPISQLAEWSALGAVAEVMKSDISENGSYFIDRAELVASRMRFDFDKPLFEKATHMMDMERGPASPTAVAMNGSQLQWTYRKLSPEEEKEKESFLANLRSIKTQKLAKKASPSSEDPRSGSKQDPSTSKPHNGDVNGKEGN